MARYIRMHGESRWALAVKFDGDWRLLGRRCWPDLTPTELRIRTFPTRSSARIAKKSLTSYRDEARVVPVTVVYHSRASGGR